MEGRYSHEVASLFVAPYRDDDTKPIGGLVAQGRDMEELVDHPGWGVVTELLDRLHAKGVDRLTRSPKPLSQAEYAQTVGFLSGIHAATDVAKTVVERAWEARRDLDRLAAGQAAEGSR